MMRNDVCLTQAIGGFTSRCETRFGCLHTGRLHERWDDLHGANLGCICKHAYCLCETRKTKRDIDLTKSWS